ncbi:hypothetical protein PCG10_004862 [Penicillium crustosum]|uniref:Uncharacterized protein n=1 Tax=Penicillium crustosum TaxID=36656 RepID=A0A9P5GQR6_PENCR|nr:hypothetical protein PCG10_004862 [Penicillium crustosum]
MENYMEDDEKKWLTAAGKGEHEKMQSIARRLGPDQLETHLLETRTKDGKTALHLAAEEGHGDVLWYLLKQGASVAARDVEKRTAFVLAAESGHSGLLKCLREYGADINARDINGDTAFLSAAKYGRLDAVKEIFEKETILGRAGLLESRNLDKMTAFLHAANFGSFRTLRYLVDQGSNTTDRDMNQDSALDLAIKGKHLAIAKWLLHNDVNITSRDVDEQNVLHRACEAGNTNIIDAILDRPLNISEEVFHRLQRQMMVAQDAWGKTPLELAVSGTSHNRHEIVLRLLRTEVHSPQDPADFEPYLSPKSKLGPIIEVLSDWIRDNERERDESSDENLEKKNRAAVTFFALSNGLDGLLDLCLTRWVILDLEREARSWVNVAALGGSVHVMEKVLEATGHAQPISLYLAAKHGHQQLLSVLLNHLSSEQHEPSSDYILDAILKSKSLRMDVDEGDSDVDEGDSDDNSDKQTLISLAAAGDTRSHHETKIWLWKTLSEKILNDTVSFSKSEVNFQVFLELVTRFESPDIVQILGSVLDVLWVRVIELTRVRNTFLSEGSIRPGLTALYQAIALGFPTVAFHFLTRRGYLTADEYRQCNRIMDSLPSHNIPLRERLQYKMIENILENPPRMTHRQAQVVDHTPIGRYRSEDDTGEIRGEIIDFWNYQERPFKFRVQRSLIADIVDNKGPEVIMNKIEYHYIKDLEKDILEGELRHKPKPMTPSIRWIHIPVNNVSVFNVSM